MHPQWESLQLAFPFQRPLKYHLIWLPGNQTRAIKSVLISVRRQPDRYLQGSKKMKNGTQSTECINGRQKKYSFVFVLISLTSLVTTDRIQKKSAFRTRLVGLICTKTKEYSFSRLFCIRSMGRKFTQFMSLEGGVCLAAPPMI